MKSELNLNKKSLKPYSKMFVDQLIEQGYKYFGITGYSYDRRPTYIEPSFILLAPIKKLSENGSNEIYEPIDSNLIRKWVEGDSDTKIFIVY
jgi:hypothetical protein